MRPGWHEDSADIIGRPERWKAVRRMGPAPARSSATGAPDQALLYQVGESDDHSLNEYRTSWALCGYRLRIRFKLVGSMVFTLRLRSQAIPLRNCLRQNIQGLPASGGESCKKDGKRFADLDREAEVVKQNGKEVWAKRDAFRGICHESSYQNCGSGHTLAQAMGPLPPSLSILVVIHESRRARFRVRPVILTAGRFKSCASLVPISIQHHIRRTSPTYPPRPPPLAAAPTTSI